MPYTRARDINVWSIENSVYIVLCSYNKANAIHYIAQKQYKDDENPFSYRHTNQKIPPLQESSLKQL